MQRRFTHAKEPPVKPYPLMVIAARARDAGSAPAILILVPTETWPAATGQLRPSHVMEPALTERLKVEASQMLPLKVLCTMPPPALTSRENMPPVTASSTRPDPVTAVSCPRASVVGDRPVTLPCLAPQSLQFSFRVPPCTNSCATGSGMTSSVAGSVLMPMHRRSSPLVPAPLMVIAARARDAGSAPAILILVPTETLPAATGQLRPSHVMEPAPTGRLKVEASQMSPLKVLCTMPPPALTSRENLPPVTASSTLPEPMTAVS